MDKPEVITTLATTVRPEMSTARMQSIVVGTLLARFTGARFDAVHGLNGRAATDKPEAELKFQAAVDVHSPNRSTRHLSDISTDFQRFQENAVESLLSDGKIVESKIRSMTCDCGIVQIERDALEATPTSKLSNIRVTQGRYECTTCGNELHEQYDVQLVTTPTLYENLNSGDGSFIQKNTYAKIDSIIDTMRTRNKLLSRTHNPNGHTVSTVIGSYVLDPDFSLQLGPSFIEEDLVTIAGSRQIEKIVGAYALRKSLQAGSAGLFMTHPRITVEGGSSIMQDIIPTDERGVIITRLIAAAAFNLTQHESKIGANDYTMLLKTSDIMAGRSQTSDRTGSLTDFLREFNPQRLRATLKRIRSNKVDYESLDMILMADLLPADSIDV